MVAVGGFFFENLAKKDSYQHPSHQLHNQPLNTIIANQNKQQNV